MKSEIRKAVELAGGKTQLAARVGVSERTVDHWLQRGHVPATRAGFLERLFRGAVRASRLVKPKERA